MVVTRDGQYPAKFGSTCSIRVTEYVTATINAWAFAIPDAKNTVIGRTLEHVDLLGSPQGGRSQIFVEPWVKFDMLCLEKVAGLPESLVKPAKWRSPISGNKPSRVQPCGLITLALHHG
ncbi:hypothetical protein D3C80_1212370 [compost metagenome]